MDAPTRILSLFSGAGGLDRGVHRAVARARTVCYVERESFAAAVLVARMAKAELDSAPIWDDVVTFDGNPWRGRVDCIIGGFPCQDISNAGKRAGIEGERSGLWKHFARIIGEVQPSCVFIENVAVLERRGLDTVLADLERLGYGGAYTKLRACDVGAAHRRERLFLLAYSKREHVRDESGWRSGQDGSGAPVAGYPCAVMAHANGERLEGIRCSRLLDGESAQRDDADGRGGASVADADVSRLEGRGVRGRERPDQRSSSGESCGPVPSPDDASSWRDVPEERQPSFESPVRGMADGLANRLNRDRADRLRALGNGVHEGQACEAFRILWEVIHAA